MEQYLASIAERYNGLEPEAKMELSSFMQSEPASLINYLLGPEMSGIISYIQDDLSKTSPQAMEAPMPQEPMVEEPPRRRGLGMRP